MIHRFLNLYCYRTVPGPPICNWLDSVGKVGFASPDASRSDNWIYRSIGRRRFSLFGLDIWKQQNHKWFIFVANFELVSLPVKAFVVMNSLRFRHLFAFNWFKITYNFTSCVCLVDLKKCIHTSIVFQSLLKLALHGFSLPIYQSRVILLLNDVSMYCSCMHQQPMTNSSSRWLPFTHSIIIPNTHNTWSAKQYEMNQNCMKFGLKVVHPFSLGKYFLMPMNVSLSKGCRIEAAHPMFTTADMLLHFC